MTDTFKIISLIQFLHAKWEAFDMPRLCISQKLKLAKLSMPPKGIEKLSNTITTSSQN
jgi:hypothetical protein